MNPVERFAPGGRKRFLSRARGLGAFYLVLAIIVLVWTLCAGSPDSLSRLGLGVVLQPPPVRLTLPTQPSLIVIGLLLGLIGLYAVLRSPGERVTNMLLGSGAGLIVLGAIIAAAADKSIDLVGLIKDSVRLATPIMLGMLAGVMCERCGVINIGIEGMMLTAAAVGYMVSLYAQNMWLGLLAAILAGGLMATLHALLTIQFMVDHIISGTCINILAVGVSGYIRAAFLLRNPFGAPGLFPYVFQGTPVWDIPILGTILFQYQPMVYTALVLVPLVWFVLFRTPWGLRTRAVGEHPRAADTVGIDVFTIRYVNVILAGCVAGLGGAWFSLETVGHFDDLMTNNRGFIALAAMIFGNWNPLGGAAGALLFGFADALNFKFQILEVNVPYQFIGMLPFMLTMIAVAGVIGRTTPPAADGQPYRKQ
ncbi:MAG: ABC transporter permease [Anaerolineae bacterium]|nr:ABC transporter permease [Anaerolineae bacterium]MDW8070829.1 ABC transporter permease [Anaerolineae bacterium]